MRKLRCFIACAFGKKDVDEVYKKVIKATLETLNIEPLRVDRVNHNDKIDRKIIELINECDFAIADLTYARPSVYYEAGFVEGLKKKVIYLARHDHTKQKEDDKEGNLKIHFDLITQNIILWERNITQTNKTLNERIKLITEPILQGLNKSKEDELIRLEFSRKSIFEKMREIRIVTKEYLESKNINLIKSDHDVFGLKGKGKKKRLIYCDIRSNLRPTAMRYMAHNSLFERRYLKDYKNISQAHLIVVSLNRITEKTIQNNLPAHKQIGDTKTFHSKSMLNDITISFVDDIKSGKDLSNKLKLIL